MDGITYVIVDTPKGMYILRSVYVTNGFFDLEGCDLIAENLTWEEADALVKLAGQ